MINGPVIKIEMEGLKAGVMHHMQRHNEEFNLLIQDTLSKTLTEDWVKRSLQEAVDRTVQNAINDLGDNYRLKSAVEGALAKALSQMIEGA